MRAFFAVDLPDALADPIAEIQADLGDAEGLTVTDPMQAHVTVKFLGEVDAESESDGDRPTVDDVIAAGERAVETAETDGGPVDSFECELTGLGVFPEMDYISVVWAGVDDGARELTALHESLEAETTALGVDPASHAFTPHVTLARMSDARGKALVQRAVRERDPEFGRFDVDEVRLMESTLTPDGPEYETVATFALG
ncbi:RNA 2',3'-cyclic phosphodiesterase [Halorubrum sp. BV1]|uniref:RNA 2',3'-cyclic phosphodiesterase n=1 Tax=Halorubrum sp. BV1 TaxID=1498500 RepID=UPI0006796AB7|nr:RNA 2',3'-cyclic phosphodiesterase [Halorubrum sp. BV1]